MVVPAVRCCFWPNTAECLEPCEPEHYRDEGRIQHLFVHISGLLVRTAPSRCCSITFDARGVVHFSSCHRIKQLKAVKHPANSSGLLNYNFWNFLFWFWDCGCKDIQQIQKDVLHKKVFGNSEFCFSRQNHCRPNGLENCGRPNSLELDYF